MKYLELTFDDPARNLACDEALLQWCEQEKAEGVLRVWEPQNYFIVLGYSNKLATEVNPSICAERGISILRRFSGGGAVLQGPGCLNYALVVENERSGTFGDVAQTYTQVLKRHRSVVEGLISEPVQIEGISDLAIGGRKFSGNAQHRKHGYTLVHGSFLLNFDLALMENCLRMPSRVPAYRQGRSHQSFLRNLLLDSATIRVSLKREWQADGELLEIPSQNIEELVKRRYSCAGWNRKF
jgi:lipoate---protein ligase